MLTLAQIGGVQQIIPRLPDPPFFARYVLENPWPLTVGLAVLGVGLGWVLLRQGRVREGKIAAGIGVLLAALVAIVGMAVTTERETLRTRTVELVDLTAKAEASQLRAMLTESARVGVYSTYYGGTQGREEVLAAVRTYIGERYPLASHEIGEVQAVVDGPSMARTQVRIWVKLRGGQDYGGSIGSWFRINWTRENDGAWRASAITVVQIDLLGLNPQMDR